MKIKLIDVSEIPTHLKGRWYERFSSIPKGKAMVVENLADANRVRASLAIEQKKGNFKDITAKSKSKILYVFHKSDVKTSS